MRRSPYSISAEPNGISRWDGLVHPFVWLTGSCWSELRKCPPSERARIAVLGSTVLVPTLLGFLGMFFYARHRSPDTATVPCLLLSLVWALVILSIDRSLLASYRPFLPWHQRAAQIGFRFVLAAIISVAISFPFCLDQFRPAINYRCQTEYLHLRDTLVSQAKDALDEIENPWNERRETLEKQIAELAKQAVVPELYAVRLMAEEKDKVKATDFKPEPSAESAALEQQLKGLIAKLETEKKDLAEKSRAEREKIIAIQREYDGVPNDFAPGQSTQPGAGPRYRQLLAERAILQREIIQLTEAADRHVQSIQKLEQEVAPKREADMKRHIENIESRHTHWLEEATRKEEQRTAQLLQSEADLKQVHKEHEERLSQHNEHYGRRIALYDRKLNGVLDPMEETIGLYKVIFTLPPEADQIDRAEQPYKWIAGLFPFLVIFGTLFVLDLIPILVKIFSRPGPYDGLIEEKEFIAETNVRALRRAYPNVAWEWAANGANVQGRIFERQYPSPAPEGANSAPLEEPSGSTTEESPIGEPNTEVDPAPAAFPTAG